MKWTITLNERELRRLISESVKYVINENIYYHGTPYLDSANSIQNNGLGGSQITKTNGGGDGQFASAAGRQYITKSGGNAMRYATMMQGNEPYGHVFEFDTDMNNLGVDEDEVGSILCKYLNGNIKSLPFNQQLLNNLSQNELNLIKQGNFEGFTSCKKIIDKLNPTEIQNILTMTNNATTNNVMKPTKHWIVPKPNEEQKKTLMQAKDFEPYNQYFEKYKQLAK